MRLVIKIGTHVILNQNHLLDVRVFKRIISEVSYVIKEGHEVVVVCSGAVAVGRSVIINAPKAAVASIGQAVLTAYFVRGFSQHEINAAQILVSPRCFQERKRHDQLEQTVTALLEHKCVPVFNENDATLLHDSFGDNDALAAMLAVIIDADKVVFLTNVDGLYSANPATTSNATLISEVTHVDRHIQNMGSKRGSDMGKGGMFSKLRAAKIATTGGVEAYITNGLKKSNLIKIVQDEQKLGTRFLPQKKGLSRRKKWLLIGAVSKGSIVVDSGARAALQDQNSLLAVGVLEVHGVFDKRSFVSVVDQDHEAFASGLVNYSSEELQALVSLKDKKRVKEYFKRAVIHIDNLSLLK